MVRLRILLLSKEHVCVQFVIKSSVGHITPYASAASKLCSCFQPKTSVGKTARRHPWASPFVALTIATIPTWTALGSESHRCTNNAKSGDFWFKNAKQNAKRSASFAEVFDATKGCAEALADCKSAIPGSNPGGASSLSPLCYSAKTLEISKPQFLEPLLPCFKGT